MPLCISKNCNKKFNHTDEQEAGREIILTPRMSNIPERAFLAEKNWRYVALPEGTVSIDIEAFYKCENLEKVFIPESVKRIRKGVFRDCFSLKDIELPNGMSEIEEYTFSRCESLKYIRIPEGVTKIGRGAFSECTSLEEVVLPSTLREIGDCAFEFCDNLRTVRGAHSVEKLGQFAFGHCKSLSDIHFSSALCSIECNSFFNSSYKLPVSFFAIRDSERVRDNVYRVPDGVCTIAAFSMAESCLNVQEELILPETVKNISRNAFLCHKTFFINNDYIDLPHLSFLPKKMNMPENYFRQKTQFDADMAFLLADTVWKNYVTDEDFEYMLLNQNSENAQKGACKRLSKNCNRHLDSMMKKSDNLPKQYEHMAAYAATYLSRIDVELLKKLSEIAKESDALKAVEILEKYCFGPLSRIDGITDMPYLEIAPPYVVEKYHLDKNVMSAINRVRWSNKTGYVPEYLVKYVLFCYINQLPEDIEDTGDCPEFHIVEDADRLVSEFEQESFLKVICNLRHYELKMLVPVCRYGTEDNIKLLSDFMRSKADSGDKLYPMVAEKALKLSETQEAFNILNYIDHTEFEEYDEDEEYDYDESEEYDEEEDYDYDESEEYDEDEEYDYDESEEYDEEEDYDYDESEEYDEEEEYDYDECEEYEEDEEYDYDESEEYDEEEKYDYDESEEYDEDEEYDYDESEEYDEEEDEEYDYDET